MQTYRVAIIGCGRPAGSDERTGAARAYAHWRGYAATGRCALVGLADIREDNAAAFAAANGDAANPPRIFTDYRTMLRQVRPDIVSVCTWPSLHAEMVIAAAEAEARGILCEKPMAPTWGEARRMAEAARRHGCALIFSHQRRFEPTFRAARRLVRSGAIGTLRNLEASCSNLFDWGTHWFDMMNFYNDDTDVQWVMGQIDLRVGHRVFGALVEDQGLSYFRYANGVTGLLTTGADGNLGVANRLIGSEGVIEVGAAVPGGPRVPLRLRGQGDAAWRIPSVEEDRPQAPGGPMGALSADLLRFLDEGGPEPELGLSRALRATELIFATYESARRRARVDLPLGIEDSPLVQLAEAGEIGVRA